jgi:hypothetical protein
MTRTMLSPKRLLALTSLAALAIAATQAPAPIGAQRELILVPHVIRSASELVPVAASVMISDPVDGRRVTLERLQVSTTDGVLIDQSLSAELRGDPRFEQLGALVERLPHEFTHIHARRRAFADERAGYYLGHEIEQKIHEGEALIAALRRDWDAGLELPMHEEPFTLQLPELFQADGPAGEEVELTLTLTWSAPGQPQRATSTQTTITRLPRALDPPSSYLQSMGGTLIQRGDLHVHSCHGEAAGACAPSSNCSAESFQLSGSFSYAQLRTQFAALGTSWFTATDHSYCINDDAEFQNIITECNSATDSSFLCLPDLELSSDEVGPQTGGDLADILCFGLTSANHMGAHGITSRIEGGEAGFLGFCDGFFSDVLNPVDTNIATINAQGGFGIANHPYASTFGWESWDATVGQESGGLHGVEIWNGGTESGQDNHVAQWVQWLLNGRVLFAYAGSDTHDEAYNYGANCVLFNGEPFNSDSLLALLRAGRLYLSNGPVLIGDVVLGGQALPMGTVHTLPPSSPAAPVTARAHYNFGASSGTITIFHGRVGGSAETVLAQSSTLTGEGTFEFPHTIDTSARTWYRVYTETNGGNAYGNPVFFQPSTSDPVAYCASTPVTQGCSLDVAFSGFPSATSTSPFLISASPSPSNRNGIFFYGFSPSYTPFNAGTLCVQPPIQRTPVQNSGGNPPPSDCSGSFSFDFNAHIATGSDAQLLPGTTVYSQFWFRSPGDPGNSAMSQAAAFTIQP